MSHSTDIETLARLMAGDFTNQAQAYENPPFFAHIWVCMRPLPRGFFPGAEISFFLEQAYDFMRNTPYRVRVFTLNIVNDQIELENYKVKEEEKFFGAARDLDKLRSLEVGHLEPLSGCGMDVRWEDNCFKGKVKPGKNCIVIRKGKESYLDNSFEIRRDNLISYDRGFDPVTDELLWGSIAGPFNFARRINYAHEVQF
jgi:hypothetical protein